MLYLNSMTVVHLGGGSQEVAQGTIFPGTKYRAHQVTSRTGFRFKVERYLIPMMNLYSYFGDFGPFFRVFLKITILY